LSAKKYLQIFGDKLFYTDKIRMKFSFVVFSFKNPLLLFPRCSYSDAVPHSFLSSSTLTTSHPHVSLFFLFFCPPVSYDNVFSFFFCIQGDRKVTQPIHDTCPVCQKINYTEIRKQKNNVILSAGNVHRVQRCMHSLFSSCLMQPGEEFLCHRNDSPDEILSICLAQENREMYPKTHSGKLSKNKMPGSVRQ
jgi:hypothetical protein